MKNIRLQAAGRRLFILVPLLAVFICFQGMFHGEKAVPALPSSAVADVFQKFQDPPAEYRSAPLWVWNDRITREQIDGQLSDFKAHGIGGVFIHPRPGLVTPYLSPEWLSLVRHAVDVGKKLGMKVWLYDENSYPSGFAGGHVPAQMPDAVRTGLRMTTAAELPKTFERRPLLILRKTASDFEEVAATMGEQNPGPGAYYIFDLNRQAPNPWYGGFTYVDILRRDVTEKFLDVTMNAYKSAIGDEFGGVVPGVFQDEAEISPAGGRDMVVVNYTPALFGRFQAQWGYDLRLQLPSLFDDIGDWQHVRHNYYATLLDLFIENWAKPYFDYCTANNLLFTGHYWEHEWPRPVVNPDSMAFCAYAHMPGIDILMNDFQLDTHAQFGNARAVKEIRSAANQMGRPRTMSETFGAGGWDMTFFDQKRIADWEYALGVNFVNQHLSYVTIKGARKRDHPLSFSYHEPWWNSYKILADYFGRLSVALSSGRQDNRVLVIEPTTTAWMYYSARGETEKVKAIGKDFQDFVNRLEAAQVEYDLGSESIIKDFGKNQGEKFIVGQQAYGLVILPPGMENLNRPTVELLDKYLSGGGRILSWVRPPQFIEGKADDRLEKLAAQYPQKWLMAAEPLSLKKIDELCPPRFVFEITDTKGASPLLLFHHRRSLKDGELIFLANTSSKDGASGTILGEGRSCEQWDLFSGKASPYPWQWEKGRLKAKFGLPPGGSLLLCFKPGAGPKSTGRGYRSSVLPPQKELLIKRESPNILTLDYCDLTLGGKTEKDLYFYEAQLKTFRHHGLDRNPWDSAVQYKTNILDKDKFAPDSGFEAAFNFDVAEGVNPASIQAVVERPELFQVSINGQKIGPVKDRWWLDRAFGVFEIGNFVKPGNNQVVLKAAPFTIHSELEPVYVLGDFGLEAQAKGFKVVPASELKLGGAWNTQGLPLYSGAVAYKKTYYLRMNDLRKNRFLVELGRWLGAVAEVKVNGKSAGVIAFQPARLDVTDFLTLGSNDVSVMVYGTLKNTLGPFHNNPRLGMAWPGSFQQGAKGGYPPGSEYSAVGYGLFDDFQLTARKTNR
jgi:hypothetical protein